MKITFEKAKAIILVATYETLLFHAEAETFPHERVHDRVADFFSAGFVQRILGSLASEGFVVIDQYDESSPRWYTLSDQGFAAAEALPGLKELIFENSVSETPIPAADRIVSKNDNYEAIAAIEGELQNLQKVIATDNGIGSELGDERGILIHEIQVAAETVKKEKFRLGSLIGWLVPALKFLAKRFAGTSVDEISTRLIALLEKLV